MEALEGGIVIAEMVAANRYKQSTHMGQLTYLAIRKALASTILDHFIHRDRIQTGDKEWQAGVGLSLRRSANS